MTINYGRYPIVIDRGEGCKLYDTDGKRYLDLFAGFGAGILGHCHPDLVDAVTAQAKRLWHPGNLLHSEPQTLLAERIAKHGFGGRSFFCHSGADANESAFKLARLHGRANPGPSGPRYKIISAHGSFHGRLFASMVATGQPKVREGFDPFVSGFLQVDYNDVDAIKAVLDDQTVAVIIEPIQGEGGVVVPHDDYLRQLRRLCDERDMLLICDEVWTGCGRTGRYFAHQHWDTTPDVMTLAKGVGGGLPVGVMCAAEKSAQLFDHRVHGTVAHATTLGGNCLSMAAAARLFDVLERDNLVPRAATLGDKAMDRLRDFAASHPTVRQVRGKGLFIGIELDKPAADIVNTCLARGVMVNGTQNTVIRLAPPLVISEAQLDEGLSVVEQAIAQ